MAVLGGHAEAIDSIVLLANNKNISKIFYVSVCVKASYEVTYSQYILSLLLITSPSVAVFRDCFYFQTPKRCSLLDPYLLSNIFISIITKLNYLLLIQ